MTPMSLDVSEDWTPFAVLPGIGRGASRSHRVAPSLRIWLSGSGQGPDTHHPTSALCGPDVPKACLWKEARLAGEAVRVRVCSHSFVLHDLRPDRGSKGRSCSKVVADPWSGVSLAQAWPQEASRV